MVPTRTGHPFWMYEEMTAAPDRLARLLNPDAAERAERAALGARIVNARRVFLTGCGTAYHAALAGASFLGDFTDGRVDARAVEAFELAQYHRTTPEADDVLIVLSHSGQPSATNAALARARAAGAFCVTITGNREGQAARNAEAVLDLGYSEVKSFAYTISYSLMLGALADLAVCALTAATGDEGTAALRRRQVQGLAEAHRGMVDAQDTVMRLARELGGRDRWIFAGAGGNYATALEAALKMQETNYTASFGMEMEEVLHGPVAALGDAVLAVIAPPGPGRTRALDLLRAAHCVGAPAVALCEEGDGELAEALSHADDYIVPVATCAEALSPALYHVPLHQLSYWVAVERGTNPDLMRREDARYLDARRTYTL